MDERRGDFVAEVKAAGYACAVSQPPRSPSWEQEQRALARWLTQLPRPVGILACNDDQGLQVLNACRRAGVLVPEDAAVIGIENDPIVCNLATPALTSIDVNPQGVGYEAAALLDRLMQGRPAKDVPTSFFEQCRVVTRQSTDVCAVSDPEVVKAVRFIRAHACEGIRIEDVLAEVCLSRSMLERRFKQVLGRTAKAEILAVQMERARQLLIETDWPLETVAQKCGIGTGKYFSDLFALKVGVRPAAYRRQHRMS
jgi:LacI family transcriptional regulator